jgi:hypothetical protein
MIILIFIFGAREINTHAIFENVCRLLYLKVGLGRELIWLIYCSIEVLSKWKKWACLYWSIIFLIDFFAESCMGFGFEDLTFHVGTDGIFQQFCSFCWSSSKLKFRAELAWFVELILNKFSLQISNWEADWMHWNRTVSESCPLIYGINQGWPTGRMRPK